MVDTRRRFIDSHVHLWAAEENDWYHFPRPGEGDFGLGLKQPFPDRFVWDDYMMAVSSHNLEKFVHVTAAGEAQHVEAENQWVAVIAKETGLSYALIGTIDTKQVLSEIEGMLDREMRNPNYRGLRLLGGADYRDENMHTIFTMLEHRDLIYDAVVHPELMAIAAEGLAAHPELMVAVEHAGWPTSLDEEQFALWQKEMASLAALPNVHCKLSGLSMVSHDFDLAILRKYYKACIAMFGVDRCMFGSNFPVDLAYGNGIHLLSCFDAIAEEYTSDEAAMLFADNAERFYRL